MAHNVNTNERRPLGYIELESGSKKIMPMNDFFLGYAFSKPENWETLRDIYNIFVNACKEMYRSKADSLQTITDEIEVETQYEYILDRTRTKRQDALITEKSKNLTMVEFHNKANSTPAIEIRGVQYFALGIGRTREEQLANQVWILAEHHAGLLGEHNPFENYALTSTLTGTAYPNASSIFYISLEKLALHDNPTGQLARFLLGIDFSPSDASVQKIVASFNHTFERVQKDKEARIKMSMLDYWKEEGRVEGREEGREEGVVEVAINMISSGMSLEQIAQVTKLSIDKIKGLVSTS